MNPKTLRWIALALMVFFTVWKILSLSSIGWLPKSFISTIGIVLSLVLLVLAQKGAANS